MGVRVCVGPWRGFKFSVNPLTTNDAYMRHDPCELSISLWELYGALNTRQPISFAATGMITVIKYNPGSVEVKFHKARLLRAGAGGGI